MTDPLHSVFWFWLQRPMTHLQVVTGDQEDASFDALPPGLGPRWVIFRGELPQLKGRWHCFGQTNCGADARTLPLCAVGQCDPLNPHVVVDLKGANLMFNILRCLVISYSQVKRSSSWVVHVCSLCRPYSPSGSGSPPEWHWQCCQSGWPAGAAPGESARWTAGSRPHRSWLACWL